MNTNALRARLSGIVWGTAVLLLASSAVAESRGASHVLTPRLVLTGHTDSVTAIVFLLDGARAVSASRDKTLRIWDARSGELLRTLKGHEGPVTCVAASTDGKLIASGAEDHTVRVWDVKTGEQVGLLEGHTKNISSVGFLAGGRLVSGAEDDVRVWDLKAEKVVWKVPTRFRVNASAVCADGSRVAFTEYDGVTRVWDVVARKRVGQFGSSKFVPFHVWLSPNGKQAIYQTGDKFDHGVVEYDQWDLEAGKRIEFPLVLGNMNPLTFSADGKHLLICRSGNARVVNAATFQDEQSLVTNFGEFASAIAISPDGLTVFLGSGGWRDSDGWQSGRANKIAVFALADPNAHVAPGPVAGAVSWDILPAQIRTKAGGTVALLGHEWPAKFPDAQLPVFRRVAENCDAVCEAGAVLLHKEAGVLDEVLVDPDANFQDVCGDGRNVWVSSGNKGVWLLNDNGEVLARAGEREGLPPASMSSSIRALSPGRVLVAGYDNRPAGNRTPAGGWCAVVESAPGESTGRLKVQVLFSEKNLPAGWLAPNGAADRVFTPAWITEPLRLPGVSGEKTPHELWVICQGTRQSNQPIVRINADTLAASAYNLWTDTVGIPVPQPPQLRNKDKSISVSRLSACWLGDGSVLSSAQGNGMSVRRLPLGDQRPDFLNQKLVLDAPEDSDSLQMHFVLMGGQLYLPGKHWFRIDPRNFEAEDMGPGLRVDGELVTEGIRYENSAVLGLCALSKTDGCFYRFSLDSAHPRGVRGTLDAPRPADRLAEAGVIERFPGGSRIRCGHGSVRISDGTDPIRIDQPGPTPEARGCDDICGRLYIHPEEQQRIGVTPELLPRLDVIRRGGYPKTDFDTSRLKSLWDSYKQATDEDGRKKAEGLVLAEVRAIGERQHQPTEEMYKQFQASFTPAQWAMLHYQKPASGQEKGNPR